MRCDPCSAATGASMLCSAVSSASVPERYPTRRMWNPPEAFTDSSETDKVDVFSDRCRKHAGVHAVGQPPQPGSKLVVGEARQRAVGAGGGPRQEIVAVSCADLVE